ncbi:MAG: YfhO family protein [Cytophagaceae bacterium]|jgi:hypothetical protein|nr:YfhO family protein [Cytophagaceae bacterium]
MKNNFWKKLMPHAIACSIFLVITSLYHFPALSGRKLVQNDVVQSAGNLQEATEYKKKGEAILWSNSMFSGMPVWRGTDNNVFKTIHYTLFTLMHPAIVMTFLAFLGFYVMMLPMRATPLVAFLTSSAFALSSFNIVSIEAGHINKVLDMALMAPVLGGMFLVYKKKYWEGALVTLIFLGLHIYYAHYQISYYLIILIGFYFISELIFRILRKDLSSFVKGSLILAGVALLAVAPNLTKIYTNYVYSKSTTRGGSELTERQKKNDAGGLDKEYALSWSNGVDEVLTIYVPYLYGGSSNENIGKNSALGKVLRNYDPETAKQFVANAPLYYGPQPFTSGPVYFGAIIVFLFFLGLVIVDHPAKWWILGASVFSLFMSMGKHFPALTNILFDFFPLYNKFRSVTMAMCIAMVTFPLLGGLALLKIMRGEVEERKLMMGLGAALAGCLLIVVYAISVPDGRGYPVVTVGANQTLKQIADSTGIAEQTLVGLNPSLSKGIRPGMEIEVPPMNYPVEILEALTEDRLNLASSDAFRSFLFSLLAAGLIWAIHKKWLQTNYSLAALCFLVLVDLFFIDKRYLGSDDFKPAKYMEKVFATTAADDYILKDTSYYRVLNTAKNPFNDATTSYHHHSVGGYSAIKLGRYQELIEYHIQRNNIAVLNMLNTKYVIMQDQKTGQVMPQRNPGALGNAWLVRDVKMVENADAEIAELSNLNPANTVIVDKRFENQLKNVSLEFDSTASIRFLSYHPDRLRYESNAARAQVAVFSEIYYQPGWNAYVDGVLTDHFRCNYVLRGMVLPAGKHTIEFKFEPAHYFTTEKVVLAASVLVVLAVAFFLFQYYRNLKKEVA